MGLVEAVVGRTASQAERKTLEILLAGVEAGQLERFRWQRMIACPDDRV